MAKIRIYIPDNRVNTISNWIYRYDFFSNLAKVMTRLKQICTSTILILSFIMGGDGIAQLAIGQWRDHLSYKKGISVTQSDNTVYCATQSGIFTLNKAHNSLERLSKINGLSDVGVKTLRFNDYNQTLLIAYQNANIDLVVNKNVYNISDIKQYIMTGTKTINNIYFINGFAYLACGFGIVVVDMNKQEIKDTYYIGKNGGYINIHYIASDNNYLYAATDSGVYYAPWSSNLLDYNSWNKFSSLQKGIYNTIISFAGKIYTNLSTKKKWPSDTIFEYNGTTWSHFINDTFAFVPVRKLDVGYNKLLISNVYGTYIYNNNDTLAGVIYLNAYQSIIDKNDSNTYWIADNDHGFIKSYKLGSGTAFSPNGPNTSEVYAMSISNEDLLVARGNHSDTWTNVYNPAEAYRFSNESWSSFTQNNIPALDTMYDFCSVAIDPSNSNHVYLGTLGTGIVEINNGALVNIWNTTNSSLQPRGDAPNSRWIGSFGMAYDTLGNLWITNCYAPNSLSVLKTDGTWQSFSFSGLMSANPTIGQIIVNRYNQKWMVLPRQQGIFVYADNSTWATNDDNKIHLTFPTCLNVVSSGSVPTDVLCMAEDKNGAIWVGTDVGIVVFFCPDQIFSSSGCQAQQIYVQQDGHTQLLLVTENVTAIAVDGANRKWIGTLNSGVFLMSADGTQQIQHFTTENSPLLSNTISSIVINPKTGEVFFGTAAGIISYRNDATEGLQDFTDVYVFPNPVNPGYEGPIAITGLVANANVKITDISGTLVYETTSLGGQAIWYGKNFKGERAHSGVYMVFCASSDGSKKFVTKILLVN